MDQSTPAMTPDDDAEAEVAAEWRQIERERIAAERAEAREDLEESSRDAGGGVAGRAARSRGLSWPLVAMVAALAAGVVLSIVVNRWIDAIRKQGAAEVEAAARDADHDARVRADKAEAPPEGGYERDGTGE